MGSPTSTTTATSTTRRHASAASSHGFGIHCCHLIHVHARVHTSIAVLSLCLGPTMRHEVGPHTLLVHHARLHVWVSYHPHATHVRKVILKASQISETHAAHDTTHRHTR